MTDPGKYILRDKSEAEAFRERFGGIVRARLRVYAKWIRSLPLMEWTPYLDQVDEGDREIVIGLICLCLIEGKANLTFSGDFRRIRRDPESEEEFIAWSSPARL